MARRSKRSRAPAESASGRKPMERLRRVTGPVAGAEQRSAELTARLGRRQMDSTVTLTDLGCPDCRGVLGVSEVGEHGWLTFRCRVGHAFSVDTLLHNKEDQLEASLWGTIEVLDEIAQLYGVLAELGWVGAARPSGSTVAARLLIARRHLRMLRRMVESEGPAPRGRATQVLHDRR